MSEDYIYVLLQFGNQLALYLKEFELLETDLSRLIGFTVKHIKDIIGGNKGVVLTTAEKISCVFGVSYYEMANPKFPLPSFDDLPKETQEVINRRKEVGVSVRNYENEFAKQIDNIIDSEFLNEPRTAKEIWQKLPLAIQKEITSPARITDLLRREPRNKTVTKVGKKGREHLFQIIK